MHFTKLVILFLIFDVKKSDAGFIDRFKPSFNWINLWPSFKKFNLTTNATLNQNLTFEFSKDKINRNSNLTIENQVEPNVITSSTYQTEFSFLTTKPSVTDHSKSFIKTINQTETVPTSLTKLSSELNLIENTTEFTLIVKNQTESNIIITNQTKSNPIISNEKFLTTVGENFEHTEKNNATNQTNLDELNNSIKQVEITIPKSIQLNKSITELNIAISNFSVQLNKLKNSTDPFNLIGEKINFFTQEVSIKPVGLVKENTLNLTELDQNLPNSTINEEIEFATTTISSIQKMKQPVELLNITNSKIQLAIIDEENSQKNLEAFKNSKTNYLKSKLPLIAVDSISLAGNSNQLTNLTTLLLMTTTQASNTLSTEASTPLSTEASTSLSKQFSTKTLTRSSLATLSTLILENVTIASLSTENLILTTLPTTTCCSRSLSTFWNKIMINTIAKPPIKLNTPIIIKTLNLKNLTTGKKVINKMAAEGDNEIYMKEHKRNYLTAKVDEAFVRFINNFYFGLKQTGYKAED